MDSRKILKHPEITKITEVERLTLSERETRIFDAAVSCAIENASVSCTNPSMQDAMEIQLATGIVYGAFATVIEQREANHV